MKCNFRLDQNMFNYEACQISSNRDQSNATVMVQVCCSRDNEVHFRNEFLFEDLVALIAQRRNSHVNFERSLQIYRPFNNYSASRRITSFRMFSLYIRGAYVHERVLPVIESAFIGTTKPPMFGIICTEMCSC